MRTWGSLLARKDSARKLKVKSIRMFSDTSSKRKANDVSHTPGKITAKKRKQSKPCSDFMPGIMDLMKEVESSQSLGVTRLPTPVKSEHDKKNYRALQLSNGMKVLLISDPHVKDTESEIHKIAGIENLGYCSEESEENSEEEEDREDEGDGSEEEEEEDSIDETSDDEEEGSDEDNPHLIEKEVRKKTTGSQLQEGERMAAAALCVSVGSFSDPSDLPGLAHFLEHMVFMGSEKYPQENALDEFVKMYGGSTNASTDYEYTTFEFEIHQRYFHEALLIFAQFFASPLLRPESMKREKKAIDSEFRMALPSDFFRKQQLFASLARTGHPMATFSWGNSTSLNLDKDPEGLELNRRLHCFWEEHYTADRMTLVLQSKHDLDQLEKWSASVFRDIPSRKPSARPCFDRFGSPFDTPQFNRILQVVPVKNVHQVCLSWALPSQLIHYRSKPLAYLSWLIGHEGHGSLLAYLRRRVWALDLSSGNDESGFEHNSTYALFSVNINLTQQGLDQVEHVVAAVFQYLAMLRLTGPDARIWQEIQEIEELSFRYVEDSPPIAYVETLAENVHKYAAADFITGDTLLFEYKPQIISDCLEALQPDKVNVMILSKKFAEEKLCNQVEPWFETQFAVKHIDDVWMSLWSSARPESFSQPAPNSFLATDFSLLQSGQCSSRIPVRINGTDDGFSMWHRVDNKFNVPKAFLSFYLVSPAATNSPRSVVMLDLLASLLKQQLMEDAYDAIVAQLEFNIHSYDRGLVIRVSGFNHKLHLLVNLIVDHLAMFDQNIRMEVFDAIKDEQEKKYRNFSLKPAKLVTEARLALLHTGHWSVVEKYHSVCSIGLNDMQKFVERLKDTFYLECLVQGNYSEEQALEVGRHFQIKLRPTSRSRSPLVPIRICQVPTGNLYCRIASFHKTDPNSVVVNYYQTGPTNLRQMAIIEVLVNLMEEPVFDVLRTQEQLGYNVNATLHNTFGVLGFSVTVDFQINKFSAEHVDERIENFMTHFERRLAEMTELELQVRIASLIQLKQRPDVSLDEEVNRNWNEILTEEYLFDRLDKEVEHLRHVKLDEVRALFNKYARSNDSGLRRKLSVQVVGSQMDACALDDAGQDVDDRQMMEISFLNQKSSTEQFIDDLNYLKTSSLVYPPLKTYNGLPDSNILG